jgi:hypothetical protein
MIFFRVVVTFEFMLENIFITIKYAKNCELILILIDLFAYVIRMA